MNRFFLLGCVLSATVFTNANAATAYREVDVPMNEMFIPTGYDDNDDITIVLDGYLPDSCHRLTRPYTKVDIIKKQIVVGARARKYRGACTQVTVPFTQSVKLGEMPQGKYRVSSKDRAQKARFRIKRSLNSGPDDFLYAPVEGARVVHEGGSRWTASLEGRFTNTCLEIVENRVIHTGKTIQLLPIMALRTQDESGAPCREEERSFREEVALPWIEESRHLLHVRSLHGEALNTVFGKKE